MSDSELWVSEFLSRYDRVEWVVSLVGGLKFQVMSFSQMLYKTQSWCVICNL